MEGMAGTSFPGPILPLALCYGKYNIRKIFINTAEGVKRRDSWWGRGAEAAALHRH